MKYSSGCLICGAELVYLPQAEEQTCVFCGGKYESNARCTQRHFVCDACHQADGNDLIEQYCIHTQATDPMAMAITLMSHPSIAMHGPEHHFMVPAVLLAAYDHQHPLQDRALKIRQARKRAEGVMGGSCGMCGNCGAAVGTGIFISLITGATPVSKEEWRLSNQMTAWSLLTIADHGGPRCCKRDTYLALQTARDFLKKNLGIALPLSTPNPCQFTSLNKECLHSSCPFNA